MTSEQIQIYLGKIIKTLFIILGLLFLLSIYDLETNKKSPEEIAKIIEKTKELRVIMATGGRVNESLPKVWPPKMNSFYPEFDLFDQSGQEFSLASLKGKVIVIEYIDISSPISQAQSGAANLGPYYASASNEVDKDTKPFSEVFYKNSGSAITLPHDDIIELKIIIYGEGGAAGSRDDAQNWAQHFGFNRSDNVIVAVPKNDFRGDKSTSIIAGYQLIDKKMRLRVDSTGADPKHNLQSTLVPLVAKLTR